MKKIFTVLWFVLIVAAFVVSPAFALDVTPPESTGFDIGYISELLQALILATVPVLAGMGARWLSEKVKLERAKLSSEQNAALDIFIKTVVFAAEQMNLKGHISGKFDYAENEVQNWLNTRGIRIDAAEIRARIQAAVWENFDQFKYGPFVFPEDPEASEG